MDLIKKQSKHDFASTLEKLEQAIEASPMNLMAKIDHAANAAKNKLELRPTTVFLFGNPKMGTPLMQSAQTLAIDLPQKMLVWQAEDDSVFVAFNSPEGLQERHAIEGQEERLGMVTKALTGLASAATE